MKTNLDKYKIDLEALIGKGDLLLLKILFDLPLSNPSEIKDFSDEDKKKYKEREKFFKEYNFKTNYEEWFTESLIVIKQLIPDRLEDFKRFYKNEKRKVVDVESYTISDYMIGLTNQAGTFGPSCVYPKFEQQLGILKSAKTRFESSLFDIKQLLLADLFDSELEAAKELNKKGFTRGAGAIAGVVLEQHLIEVSINHGKKMKKKEPLLGELNQHLKDGGVYDIPTWRFIDHLISIRNLCDHKKITDPKKEDVEELILGVEKIIRTIF